jgi:magnesium transporter
MRAFLYTGSDVVDVQSLDDVASRVPGLPFWWLDISDPPVEAGALAAVVREASDAAWLADFGHLPRFQSTDDSLRVRVPVYDTGHVQEVHAVLANDRLVTCHADAQATFTALRERSERDKNPPHGMAALVLVLEDMLATFRPVLADLRKEMYDLSEDILVRPSKDQMRDLSSARRRVQEVRVALATYADAANDYVDRLSLLPAMPTADRLVLQAHASHAASMAQQVEALQDAGTHAIETYVSMVTTRQGQVINWLTFVSIVFLPLTFITGFFGMNFDWMVNNVTSAAAFWILGVGMQVVVVAVVFIAGRRLFPVLRGDVQGSPATGLDISGGPPPGDGG